MAEKLPIRIAVISDNPDPHWVWIRDLMGNDFQISGRALEWQGFSTAPAAFSGRGFGARAARRFGSLARYQGAHALAKAAKNRPFDLIVSHGPLATAWSAGLLGSAKNNARHLAFSFNFTDIPTGLRKTLMARAFKAIDAFAVFTDCEQQLYADTFGIDPQKILRAPWGVATPLKTLPAKQIAGAYMAALGGEARDYETLCRSARLCPDIKFVAIARPRNFDGLIPPANLDVRFNLPFDEAWGLVAHADAALIPLRSRDTPCGLVTLVGAMHLGKAQIVTEAAGVSDYIRNGETGILTPPGDADAMAAAVQRLHQDPTLAARLGDSAKTYAAAHFSESATIAFFRDCLSRWFA